MPLRRKTLTAAVLSAGFTALLGGCNAATGNIAAEAENAASIDRDEAAANASASPVANGKDAGEPVNALEGDALVPETGFSATATVSCVTRAGRAPRDCSAGVVRNRDGSAIVTIFWPEGRSRAIFFDSSHRAFGADTSEADGSADQPFRVARQSRSIVVTIGPERYVIPDSLVVGN